MHHGNVTLRDAEVGVQNCTASEGGGISLDQSNLTQHGGRLQISKCAAVVEGEVSQWTEGSFR